MLKCWLNFNVYKNSPSPFPKAYVPISSMEKLAHVRQYGRQSGAPSLTTDVSLEWSEVGIILVSSNMTQLMAQMATPQHWQPSVPLTGALMSIEDLLTEQQLRGKTSSVHCLALEGGQRFKTRSSSSAGMGSRSGHIPYNVSRRCGARYLSWRKT